MVLAALPLRLLLLLFHSGLSKLVLIHLLGLPLGLLPDLLLLGPLLMLPSSLQLLLQPLALLPLLHPVALSLF